MSGYCSSALSRLSRPMFTNSSTFSISHSQLISYQITTGSGIDVLYNEAMHEAAYDSYAREPPPRCQPGSREDEINNIISWATSSTEDSRPPLLLVSGEPGAGKTALAQTCMERLKEKNIPSAGFFISSGGQCQYQRFFPTLAYQLSTEFPEYRAILDIRIRRDRSLLTHKTMESQFKRLILDPFRELEEGGKAIKKRIPIIVDGLGKCDNIAAQFKIVELAAAAATKIPFCWAFFGRPEPYLESVISSQSGNTLCIKHTLPGAYLYASSHRTYSTLTSDLPRDKPSLLSHTQPALLISAPTSTIPPRPFEAGWEYPTVANPSKSVTISPTISHEAFSHHPTNSIHRRVPGHHLDELPDDQVRGCLASIVASFPRIHWQGWGKKYTGNNLSSVSSCSNGTK